MITLILATILVLWITLWYRNYYKYNKYLSNIPGPFPVPIIGEGYRFTSAKKVIRVMQEYYRNYGEMAKFMVLDNMKILLTAAKPLEILLTSNTILKKSDEYRHLGFHNRCGLLHSWGNEWRKQRKILNTCFHSQMLNEFIPIMNSQADVLIEKLCDKVGEEPFDLLVSISMCTLDVICETVMGIAVDAQKNSHSKYVWYRKELLRIAAERMFSPFKKSKFLFKLSKDYKKVKEAANFVRLYRNSVITRKKEELFNSHNETIDNHTHVNKKFALLSLLLQTKEDGEPLSDEYIETEVDTFITAGSETTATAACFALYCLSRNPEIQKRAVDELNKVQSRYTDTPISFEYLNEIKYIEMIIKETMRLYPPIPFIGRTLEEDVKFGETVIPKDVVLVPLIMAIHRKPDIYPDPEKFDPERFSPENSRGRAPCTYLPFSSGPRNCIGQRFAMLEMKVIISKVLRNFELLPVPNHQPILDFATVLTSNNGLPLILKKRELNI